MVHPKHIVAVSGLISHSNGKILLIRSPRRGWEFPGGQVEEGENLIEALQREIQEEAGATASVGPLVGIYSNIRSPTKLMFGFLGDYVSGKLSASAESLETEWVARDSVLQRVSNPVSYDLMKDMLDFSGQVIYRVYTTDPYQKKFIIWVDTNGNHLAPGIVLTSMTKEIPASVQHIIRETAEGDFMAGIRYFGIADGGVSYAVDEHNQPLLSDDIVATVESLKAKIIADEVVVPDTISLPRE